MGVDVAGLEPLAASGRIEEAHALSLRAIEFSARSSRPSLASSWATRSLCELLLGDVGEARRSAEAAAESASDLGGGEGRVWAGFALARVAIWSEAGPLEAEARRLALEIGADARADSLSQQLAQLD